MPEIGLYILRASEMGMETAKVLKQVMVVLICVGVVVGSCLALDRPQVFYTKYKKSHGKERSSSPSS